LANGFGNDKTLILGGPKIGEQIHFLRLISLQFRTKSCPHERSSEKHDVLFVSKTHIMRLGIFPVINEMHIS